MNRKTTTEFEIEVSGGRIIGENLPLKDGKYKVVAKNIVPQCGRELTNEQKNVFRKVPASELSLDDEFMKYQPKRASEQKFKKLVEMVINNGIKDFWRPVYDPSFDKNGNICFVSGKKPAVGKNYNWWFRKAKEFCPEHKSRLGTESEYIAFLAVLIKKLMESGWTAQEAWYAVCTQSRDLGHYKNSKKCKPVFEKTGCRQMCGFFDLANTSKILAVEEVQLGGLWIVGGYFDYYGGDFPLAHFKHYNDHSSDKHNSVGWIVIEDM